MANHRTFQIPPIQKLIRKYTSPGLVIDPFPFESKVDCFDYLDTIENESADLALVDPPYTRNQVSEHYKKNGGKVTGWHTSSGWTSKVKRIVASKIKPGGIGITFGYNSSGLGKKNGMKIIDGLIICHGGDHYDTICTVDKKIQTTLGENTMAEQWGTPQITLRRNGND